ncbi:GNAT family N-acetyltransferase [Limobrevibacterium gyesilva]|uniref:GNAT family N-acetyltransferase n=1 Tax=Limobrevibacterium gyesilva TaxID=2991712 RepID=A0AA41YLR2_9PROT|nr:GNAT family N-acetyltransferase [Limobrevibacterium gyesilva]MCW3475794.1 GNAT family N-acetyltransferase [Limobrevibacterium gyesilva]
MLTTARLVLRHWREDDLDAVAAMTADPVVMRYFLHARSRAQSDAWVAGVRAHFDRTGFGIWAVEAPGVAAFIGFVGLSQVPADMPSAPSVEAVWTLDRPYWNRGYASEAARAAMADGFTRLGLDEIVAFTTVVNTPSRAVMERLGMVRDPTEDFDHPRVPAGHRLARHVLYRKKRDA